MAIQNVDLGVPPEQILTMRVPLAPARYPDATRRIQFFQELIEKASAVPGVAAVGLNTGLHPFGNFRAACRCHRCRVKRRSGRWCIRSTTRT